MKSIEKLDQTVPGGVYFCQLDDNTSCGACCGLYNVEDPTYDGLNRMLQMRTRVFESLPRVMDEILQFKDRFEISTDVQRPFEDFYHCPFLGLIGGRKSRIGCLLHPLASGNQGVDYRGLSHYGGFACNSYFCHAFKWDYPEYKKILRRLFLGDWYTYGLVVTDVSYVNALFALIERILARPINLNDLHEQEVCLLLSRIFSIKLSNSKTALSKYDFVNDVFHPQQLDAQVFLSSCCTNFSDLDVLLHRLKFIIALKSVMGYSA